MSLMLFWASSRRFQQLYIGAMDSSRRRLRSDVQYARFGAHLTDS